MLLANSPSACCPALRIVAVEAMTFGPTDPSRHNTSTAVSYKPVIVPNGPEIRCSSS